MNELDMHWEKLKSHIQQIAPQFALSKFAGWLANCKIPAVKNQLIAYFLSKYTLNLSEAIEPDPFAYACFQDLFTRRLKPESRPIQGNPAAIVSPVDAQISQLGEIRQDQLLQAKGFEYSLQRLLAASSSLCAPFINGQFCTLYLAPNQYHRVHMPLSGTLEKAAYVPGKLFSVNQNTAAHIDNLFTRNERIIAFFETPHGPFVLVLVAAMLVGQIGLSWPMTVDFSKRMIQTQDYSATQRVHFTKGDEIGHFKMGSTVILLLSHEMSLKWAPERQIDTSVKMGELLATLTGNL